MLKWYHGKSLSQLSLSAVFWQITKEVLYLMKPCWILASFKSRLKYWHGRKRFDSVNVRGSCRTGWKCIKVRTEHPCSSQINRSNSIMFVYFVFDGIFSCYFFWKGVRTDRFSMAIIVTIHREELIQGSCHDATSFQKPVQFCSLPTPSTGQRSAFCC